VVLGGSEHSDAGVGWISRSFGSRDVWCFGFLSTHGSAFEGDAVGVVDEAIEDGVGEGGVSDGFVPSARWGVVW
jgi:hypothetical protein